MHFRNLHASNSHNYDIYSPKNAGLDHKLFGLDRVVFLNNQNTMISQCLHICHIHCYQHDILYFLAEPPKIITHPEELKDTVPGKPVSFTVQATGVEPMSYQWQWKPIGKEEQWQNFSSDASVQGTDTSTLTFSISESCSEGLYRCIVTNCSGAVQSECVDHIIGELQHVHTH